MDKICDVVMLPAKKAILRHIYLVTDEKVKPGELFMVARTNIYRYDPNNEFRDDKPNNITTADILNFADYRKIIASTDQELGGPQYRKSGEDEYECTICGQDHIERNARATYFTPCKCVQVRPHMIPESFVKVFRESEDAITSVRVKCDKDNIIITREDDTVTIRQTKQYSPYETAELIRNYIREVHFREPTLLDEKWIRYHIIIT